MQTQIRRSFSVPGNAKNGSLRRMDSIGLVRVISATPRPVAVDNAIANDDIEAVNGTSLSSAFYNSSCLIKSMLKHFLLIGFSF